jgi:hypothetical protein
LPSPDCQTKSSASHSGISRRARGTAPSTVRWHKEHDVPDNFVRSAHLSSLSEDDCASQNARHVTCHCIELGDEYPDCCPDGGAVLPRPGRWAVVATAYPSTSNDFVRPKLRQSLTRPTSYRLYHFYTTFIPLLYHFYTGRGFGWQLLRFGCSARRRRWA